jgi:hypothetical protein
LRAGVLGVYARRELEADDGRAFDDRQVDTEALALVP